MLAARQRTTSNGLVHRG